MKMATKMKTAKLRYPQKRRRPKNEDDTQNEDNPKKGNDAKIEDYHTNEEDPKNEGDFRKRDDDILLVNIPVKMLPHTAIVYVSLRYFSLSN